jgi:hypothetical protein
MKRSPENHTGSPKGNSLPDADHDPNRSRKRDRPALKPAGSSSVWARYIESRLKQFGTR